MARKLKTYQTSLGFFEQAIAAPSMKAALEAWGADSNLFHQGAAKESTDPDVIAATMKRPGVVLKRPVGSDGPFGEQAELPKDLGLRERKRPAPKPSVRKAKKSSAPSAEAADRKAAQAYERERQRREREEAKRGGGQAEAARTQAAGRRQGASGLDRRAHLRLDQPVPSPRQGFRAICSNHRRLRPPRHDPPHAQPTGGNASIVNGSVRSPSAGPSIPANHDGTSQDVVFRPAMSPLTSAKDGFI
jgi:hypothetical protein